MQDFQYLWPRLKALTLEPGVAFSGGRGGGGGRLQRARIQLRRRDFTAGPEGKFMGSQGQRAPFREDRFGRGRGEYLLTSDSYDGA